MRFVGEYPGWAFGYASGIVTLFGDVVAVRAIAWAATISSHVSTSAPSTRHRAPHLPTAQRARVSIRPVRDWQAVMRCGQSLKANQDSSIEAT